MRNDTLWLMLQTLVIFALLLTLTLRFNALSDQIDALYTPSPTTEAQR